MGGQCCFESAAMGSQLWREKKTLLSLVDLAVGLRMSDNVCQLAD